MIWMEMPNQRMQRLWEQLAAQGPCGGEMAARLVQLWRDCIEDGAVPPAVAWAQCMAFCLGYAPDAGTGAPFRFTVSPDGDLRAHAWQEGQRITWEFSGQGIPRRTTTSMREDME